MSLTPRRGLSWVLTLASLTTLAIGITHLPGAGGMLAELHWLLARDNSSPAQRNRAFWLLFYAEDNSPGSAARLLPELLHNSNPRIVRGCLKCIAPPGPVGKALREAASHAFLEWFRQADINQKVAFLPETFSCWFDATGGIDTVTCGNAFSFTVPSQDAMAALDRNNRRWIIAATAAVRDWMRDPVEMIVFPESRGEYRLTIAPESTPDPSEDVALRLRYIDALDVDSMFAKLVDIGELPRIGTDLLCQLIGIPVDELLAMLSDPIDQVRWGAGRILAVAGDERGLPAFCDWLQHNPRFTSNANKLMIDLFGPDWRTHCASGSPTSQPRERDGGG